MSEAGRSGSIGGHTRAFKGATDDWITPKELLDKLGPFDLDPCICTPQPWPTAARGYTQQDNGLVQPWGGRVWLNPPYGPATGRWLERLAVHGNGVALVFARTETRMFFAEVWPKASALLFLEGRLFFHRPDGTKAAHNSGGPSVLIAYGEENARLLQTCSLPGAFVRPVSR